MSVYGTVELAGAIEQIRIPDRKSGVVAAVGMIYVYPNI